MSTCASIASYVSQSACRLTILRMVICSPCMRVTRSAVREPRRSMPRIYKCGLESRGPCPLQASRAFRRAWKALDLQDDRRYEVEPRRRAVAALQSRRHTAGVDVVAGPDLTRRGQR